MKIIFKFVDIKDVVCFEKVLVDYLMLVLEENIFKYEGKSIFVDLFEVM